MTSDAAPQPSDLYGLLIELPDPESLIRAARRVEAAGYKHIDAYSPMPVEGLAEALGVRRTRMPYMMLMGGLLGGCAGFALQVWVNTVAYPLNIGGRPLVSWPAFIPVTFEMTILGAALFGVLGMLALNRLPTPYHPLFAIPEFDRASQSGFFLCIESTDPLFDDPQTRELLSSLADGNVIEVPRAD
jgi:hypothetical protein